MKKSLKIITMVFVLGFSIQIHSQDNADDKEKINEFFQADTQDARNLLSSFSDKLLENYTNTYKESLKKEDARKFWLVEEYYKRQGDKTAADRLFYVFLAVGLLMILIFLLVFRIYTLQKNLEKMD